MVPEASCAEPQDETHPVSAMTSETPGFLVHTVDLASLAAGEECAVRSETQALGMIQTRTYEANRLRAAANHDVGLTFCDTSQP